jgi:diguanylate cyclase (GGDEF)-like protein
VSITAENDGSIATVLDQLRETAGLEGIAVVDLTRVEGPPSCSAGVAGIETVAVGRVLLLCYPRGPVHVVAPDRRPVLACPWTLPPDRPGGLLLWREPGGRPWAATDHGLAASVALLLRLTVSSAIGRPVIDGLTGVPNRRWFMDEADRHIDRLDRDGAVGTLTLVDIDDLRRLNTNQGRPEGDRALVRLASHLRASVRPSDLVARVGADEFAVWQDNVDHLTAAERAEDLCTIGMPGDFPCGHATTLSVGIASRRPGTGEDVRTLLRRAHMAVRDVKSAGGGGWRVSRDGPPPLFGRPRE